jgi:hypothetical protein
MAGQSTFTESAASGEPAIQNRCGFTPAAIIDVLIAAPGIRAMAYILNKRCELSD